MITETRPATATTPRYITVTFDDSEDDELRVWSKNVQRLGEEVMALPPEQREAWMDARYPKWRNASILDD